MQLTTAERQRERITYPQLPLAIYRELAAHLQQVPGVTVQLLPQDSPRFDYLQSQAGGLQIEYPQNLDSRDCQQLKAILNYYGEIYGS
jgi:hypothetical protein